MRWRIESGGHIVKVGALDRAIQSIACPPDGVWQDSPAFYSFPADDRPPRLTRGLAACPGSITELPMDESLEDLHQKLEVVFAYWLHVENDQSPYYPEEMNRETVRFWMQDVGEQGRDLEQFGLDFSSQCIDWDRIEASTEPLDEVSYNEIVNG